jgi:predicted ester cyclase
VHYGRVTEPKAVVEELFLRLNTRDVHVLDDLVAEDMANHAAGPQGREGLRQILANIGHDFGDGEVEHHHVIAEGEFVANHVTVRGVHRASTMPLLTGTEPTGVEVSWTFIHIWRVVDGQIVEHWACRDDLGLLHQIGAWPPTGTRSAISGPRRT